MSKLNLTRRGWHAEHENVSTLLCWAANEGLDSHALVRIHEKPWKWRAEFCIAYCGFADRQRAERMRRVQFS